MKTPAPRHHKSTMYGDMRPTAGALDTWIESEAYAYPNGGFTRRARVICPDGKPRIVLCSIADTYFSIPAVVTVSGKRIKGFISADAGDWPTVFRFNSKDFPAAR